MTIKTLKFTLISFVIVFQAACTDNLPQEARELPDATSPGARLLVDKCTGCHGAPHPDVHPIDNWKAVLHRMQNRMTMKAHEPLTQEEFATLLEYLQHYAGAEKK